MDTNGSIATTHYAAEISIKSLHVQDKGTFELKSYHHSYTWGINATNITVLFSHTIKIQSSGTDRSSLLSVCTNRHSISNFCMPYCIDKENIYFRAIAVINLGTD